MDSLDLNNTYMRVDNTAHFFPRFKYNENNIPVGNSMAFCISLHWTTHEQGENFDLAKEVKGTPQCEMSKSGKFIWNEEDSIFGIDVPAWSQSEMDVDCTDQEDCESTCEGYDALFLNGKRGKKCFSYKILSSICLTVSYDKILDEFTYRGGCFQGGNHYLMESPVKDSFYYFDKINIEIRNSNDPVIKAGKMSNYSYSFGASLVSK